MQLKVVNTKLISTQT